MLPASQALPETGVPEGRNAVLQHLREACAGERALSGDVLGLGLGPIDAVMPRGGLRVGAVHEWLGLCRPAGERSSRQFWTPPLSMLIHVARRAITGADVQTRAVVWIGAKVWAHPPVLSTLLDVSLFVRAERPAQRLWAADLALRSGAAGAVIADGTGLDMASTRRLQLAAEAGRTICVLARPEWEASMLSAATTRWRVTPAPVASVIARGTHIRRRWIVELLRCKGMQPTSKSARRWLVEDDHAARAGLVVADILDGHDTASAEKGRRDTA
jgi:protein ImuA